MWDCFSPWLRLRLCDGRGGVLVLLPELAKDALDGVPRAGLPRMLFAFDASLIFFLLKARARLNDAFDSESASYVTGFIFQFF